MDGMAPKPRSHGGSFRLKVLPLSPIKLLSSARILLPLLAALFSLALTASLLVAAPAPAAQSHLGQALALRAALRPLALSGAHAKSFQSLGVPQDLHRAEDGRYIYTRPNLAKMRSGAILRSHAATTATAQVNEAVQTFDVFNPPPAFALAQGQSLTPTNLSPVWTADETMLVFSSNRTATGTAGTRYHIWAIPVNGGTPVQLTTSTAAAAESAALPHGEFFPALSAGNNQELAFTSDANTANIQNLYVAPFTATAYAVNGKPSLTNRGLNTSGASVTGIAGVQRPVFSPSNADEIVFSGLSATGNYAGHQHLYFLYQSTGGYNQATASLPGKLTDGPADDTDPAYSQDGQFIAFASTAAAYTATNAAPSADPNTAPLATSAAAGTTAAANRSIFLMTGQYAIANGGQSVTLAGTDNFGPAWSTTATNPYLNPAPGFEYIAFARGAAQNAPHDIFYLKVLQNTQAGGESGRSNEASSTPEDPAINSPLETGAPVYQVNAGDPATGVTVGGYVLDNFTNPRNNNLPSFLVNGGTADAPANPPLVFNTTADPGTPPQIYQTDRSGTFTYTFPNLTPNATYTVRLHLADPKDTAAGKRVFNVIVNGNQPEPNIDIVGMAQQTPGRLDGLVTDTSTGQPLGGATITIQGSNTAPLTTTATTIPDPNTVNPAGPVNYNGPVTQGTYTLIATAPGYGSVSRVVTINSGAYTRADFELSPGNATFSGTVTDANGVGVSGATISVIDVATNSTVVTTPSPVTVSASGAYGPVTVAPGTYYITATPPAGSTFTTQTQKVTVTAATPATANFTLLSTTSANVGSLGGLVTSSATTAPLANATVTVIGAGNAVVAILPTSAATTTPAAPNGDGKPVNYFANLPTGSYTLQFSEPGFATTTSAVTVVNTPANGATPATAFVRGDKALVPTTSTAGQPVAVVVTYQVRVPTRSATDKNGLVIAPAGAITLAFNPVAGDPPIVQGIEILSDSRPSTSSGFGTLGFSTFSNAAPEISVLGGVATDPTTGMESLPAAPLTTLTITNLSSNVPVLYNIYRSNGNPTSDNEPSVTGAGTELSTIYKTIAATPDPATGNTTFVDTGTGTGDGLALGSEYYYQVTAVFKEVLAPESASNPVVKLNTDDPSNAFDDIYPTWSPFRSIFSIAYSSNRSVTYTTPGSGTASETAISIAANGSLGNGGTVGANYAGLLESQVVNLDPPTLVPYSGNEVFHINSGSGYTAATSTRTGVTPGQPATVTVRLSDREAGIDDGNVYLQIKDPDSKYQDAQGLEHKVFASDTTFRNQSNNPNLGHLDSGSSTRLINGGDYTGFNQFPINGNTVFINQRGSIGGIDGPESGVNGGNAGAPIGSGANGSDTISVGRDGGGINSQPVRDGDGKPVLDANKNPVQLPGGDPFKFIPTGPEFEAQVVNPQFSLAGLDTVPTDYTNPYYLAGVDDQQPFSGFTQFATRPPTEWLSMTRLPAAQQDGQGGILYSVTWKTPTSPSDYYLDVIAYDKAVSPGATAGFSGSNWRIYDNAWGFSTQAFNGTNDILVVSDYTLGQKFAATTFGGQRGLLNLVPKLYGAESYVTDIDDSLLPNAIYRHAVYPGANANNPQSEVLDIGVAYDPTGQPGGEGSGQGRAPFNDQPFPIANGLGVNSYFDRFINDGGTRDGATAVRSQLYSLWRVLARGPVPASVYASYEPTLQPQPAVNDSGGAKTVTAAAGTVSVATRCILWISPFTGDVLAGPGTLADPNTQNDLRAFVKAGGRLCVSGQDVGSALTQGGTVANTTGGFLSDVLNATLVSSNQGTHLPVGGTDNVNNRISNIPSYDGELQGAYQEIEPNQFNTTPVSPSHRPIRISNNYGGNIFSFQSLFGGINITAAFSGNWRTDGSLDQLGPYIQGFTSDIFGSIATNTNSVVGQIDTIKPNAGANVHTDLTLAPFANPIAPVDNGNDNAASAPGGVGLIYSESPLGTTGGGTGSKVVYATFGLEALSTEYYKQTGGFKPNPVVYLGRNQRQNILHNIVSYLRTGSISGTIRSTTGNNIVGAGIPGAIVYLQSAYGPAIPGRGTFSATTDSAGNYTIGGVEPGNYTLVAYKTGYSRAVSNPGTVLTVEGDVAVAGANLTLVQGSPGIITGSVTDVNGKPAPGATVTFTPSGGGTPQTTITDTNGNYTLSNVPPGTYIGTAVLNGATAASPSVNVVSGQTITVPFKLAAGAGSATGRVVDVNGSPIAGATVFFNGGGSTAARTATTDSTGTYTFQASSLPAGIYVVSATKTGYGNSAPVQAVVTSAATTTVQDIVLSVAANGTLGGLVTATGSSTPLGGVTITITNSATGVAFSPSPVTTGTATAGPDGSSINYGPVTLLQGTYTVTAAQSGAAPLSQTVTVPANGFVRADFTGATGLAPLHTFPAGLQFVSTPYDYSALGFNGLFGTLNTAPAGTTSNGNRSNVAVWNPLTGAYALDPNAPADTLRLGVGYWVYLKSAMPVTQAGAVPSGSVQVSLNPAWNQIGVPSTAGVLVSSLTFAGSDGVPHPFADAAGSTYHLVSPTLYSYNGTSYQTVTAGATLQPWQAYWIQVYTPVTMSIPTGR